MKPDLDLRVILNISFYKKFHSELLNTASKCWQDSVWMVTSKSSNAYYSNLVRDQNLIFLDMVGVGVV